MKKTSEQIEHAIAFLYELVDRGEMSKEFADLQAERIRRQEPYSDPRWYQPLGGEVAEARVSSTKKEREVAQEELHSILRKIGVLQEEK